MISLRKIISCLVACALGLLLALPAFAATTDTEVPSYVDNVTAVAGDGEVLVSWDAATDNVTVTGYKIYYGTESVAEAGQSYNLGFIEVSDVLEYTVTGLENDLTYYFAVTALDPTGNESLEYSLEASATPTASEDDGNPPSVVLASATACTEVQVTFSESVTFPETGAEEAFEIENFDTLQFLKVTAVATGDSPSVVLLTTETMEEGAQYLLTVSSTIEDLYGHAVGSGTSDTGSFKGVACAEETTDTTDITDDTADTTDTADTAPPVLEDIDTESLTEIVLTFDEEVVLPNLAEDGTNPALDYFEVYDLTNTTLSVTQVEYYREEESDSLDVLVLTTAEQLPQTEYFMVVTGLPDAAGNATTGDTTSSREFTSVEAEEEETEEADTIAPEDVTDLVSSVLDNLVSLSWKSSLNSAGDLIDQILYVSDDGGTTYERLDSLGSATNYSYEGGVEGTTYSFRVTTIDDAGNESSGAVVTAVLPTTGPGLLALAAASLLGGGLLGRRKKK